MVFIFMTQPLLQTHIYCILKILQQAIMHLAGTSSLSLWLPLS